MSENVRELFMDFGYLAAAFLFILGIKKMNSPRTARLGNGLAALGMLAAVLVTLGHQEIVSVRMIGIGILAGSLLGVLSARLVRMTAMPQMVAIFNGFGGLASVLVTWSEFARLGGSVTGPALITILAGSVIGAMTFTGSMIAFGKLQGIVSARPVTYPFQNGFNMAVAGVKIALIVWILHDPSRVEGYWALLALSLLAGGLMVLPIGGADMPVVVSLLNSLSGIAAAMAGFVILNKILIIGGALVGAAGFILTSLMCRAMNRSLANVIFGAFGKIRKSERGLQEEYSGVRSTNAEEAALMLENAGRVILVPGYGLAVSRAQHSLKELANVLEKRGVDVRYAIHPVAGRMPGHMNVLLAEAEVPYDRLFEMEAVNPEFEQTDLAVVVGANDVTNPAAKEDPDSPIYGMPVLDVAKAKNILVIKRSLSPGFAGIKNPLFENEKTLMLFEDAKRALDDIVKELKG